MFREKDVERLWFLYKTEGESKGISINSFCIINICSLDFVIASPKILRQRVLLFSDVLPSALFGCKPPCSEVA